jgi:hypothetical protein
MIPFRADGLRVLAIYKDNERPIAEWPVAIQEDKDTRQVPLGEIWDRAGGKRREMQACLEKFVGHYPGGINPALDAAYRESRAVLAKAPQSEFNQYDLDIDLPALDEQINTLSSLLQHLTNEQYERTVGAVALLEEIQKQAKARR